MQQPPSSILIGWQPCNPSHQIKTIGIGDLILTLSIVGKRTGVKEITTGPGRS